jgi:hypothetical protein
MVSPEARIASTSLRVTSHSPWADHSPAVKSEIEMPSAFAMTSMFRRDKLRLPRSMPLMYVRSRRQRSANASWESPSRVRSSRTRRPNLAVMSALSAMASP